MRFETIVTVAPTIEPVTLAEAKAQLRLGSLFTADDAYITALISVARDRAEQYCNRFFSSQTVKIVYLASMPDGAGVNGSIELPYSGLTVVSVGYTDSDGADQTIDSADYTYSPDTKRLSPVGSWPFAIDFTVTATTSAPVEYSGPKQAILMMLTDMYELRVESVVGASVAENKAVNTILTQYRENMGV